MKETNQKSNKVWMIVVIVAIIALVGLGIYSFITIRKLNKQISDQKSQITQLNSQIPDKDKKISELESQINSLKTPQTSSTTQTDEQKIIQVLKNQCEAYKGGRAELAKYSIKAIKGNFAQASYICVGAQDGPIAILKRAGNAWWIVAQGLGENLVTQEQRLQYGIPSEFPIP